MDPPTNQPAGASSSFKTPQMDQSEWSAATPTTTTTPSRHTFPRRLSLLQNDAASPARSETPQEASRRTSFTGPKPLNLVSQPLSSAAVPSSASSSGPDTPRKGKRTSLSYIPSPSTSKIDDGQLSRAQSTSSAAGRTRTGSISRATTSSRRRPSQASQASAGANSDADDWLMSEEDASFSLPSAARAMAGRDSAKVEAQFQDTGYREGITAGKLSTLQNGFDQGFNEVGAPLGREVGMLRGQLAALLLLTSPSPSADAAGPRKGVGRATGRMRPANSAATPSLPLLGHPRLAEAQREMRALAAELDSVSLGQLAEPDYDALVHDHEHAVEAGDAAAQPSRETEEQRQARTAVLVRLHKRLERNGALTGPTRDLLRLIAEKERRCFELRDELAAEEAELKQLRAAWQRSATRELAYGTSPTHRRNGSASSSTTRPSLARTDSTDSLAGLPVGVPQAAAEAWNSLSAKLPGGLKSQLNSLLESIAMDQPPEVPEKRAEDAGMLRPAPLGTLGVLEEEGSDVGSAAVSPRSPRSPAGPMAGVRGAAQEQDDSSVLGFKVDANGIATPSVRLSEQPPPTPPKEGAREGNTWQSRRTSVLGSWSQLQSKLTGEADSGGGGLAGMFTRRLKEARHNASDLLREAERKLGNAMTIDELLGISNDEPPSPQPPMARSRSPQIRLEGVATETSWAEAAVGVRSPNLAPADAVGRTSASSSRSSLSLQLPVRSASPHSPPIGGAPGAAAFGVLHNGSSSSINRVSTNSVDGWNWTKHEHEWDE